MEDKRASVSSRQRHALTALRHREFRLLWTGQLVSTTGDQMQAVALAWQLYLLTNSTLRVGLIGLFSLMPFLMLSLFGGAAADRFDRKKLLFCTQTLMMCYSGVLIVTTVSHTISPTLIYGIAFCSGFTRAFDAPARQALIPSLVPPDELANALTLNTMVRQLATIAGPGVGGLVLGLFGLSLTYAVNFASFIVLLAALLAMRTPPLVRKARNNGNLQQVLGGLHFVLGEPLVLSVLMLDLSVTALGSVRALMPAFARDVLATGPQGLGFLYAAPAAGAVLGTLILGALGAGWRRPVVILGTSAVFGLCTIGFGLSRLLPLSLVFLFGTGLMDVIGEVMRATIVQLRTPDDLRGRVTALSVLEAQGGPQLGQIESGALGSLLGPATAAVIAGTAVLAAVAGFALVPALRRPVDVTLAPGSIEPEPSVAS